MFVDAIIQLLKYSIVYYYYTEIVTAILHPATLVNVLVSSSSFFLVDSIVVFSFFFVFLYRGLCHLQINIIWLFFPLIWMHLFLFSSVIMLAKNSRIMLSRSSKSDYLSLFLVLFLFWVILSGMNVRSYQIIYLHLLRSSYEFSFFGC